MKRAPEDMEETYTVGSVEFDNDATMTIDLIGPDPLQPADDINVWGSVLVLEDREERQEARTCASLEELRGVAALIGTAILELEARLEAAEG